MTVLLAVVLPLVLTACEDYGRKLQFGKGELFYTQNVGEAEAKKLGTYLSKSGFFDDEKEKSVQLDKSGDIYQVRLAMQKGAEEDSTILQGAKGYAIAIAKNVFDDKKVEIHLCDQYFETRKVIPAPDFGKRLTFKGGDLYFMPPVTEGQATELGNYLTTEGFFDGKPKSAQLKMEGSDYLFRVVMADEESAGDSAMIELFREVGTELSHNVLHDAPVTVHLCDSNFETLQVVPPAPTPAMIE
jgi:hypothetical protein